MKDFFNARGDNKEEEAINKNIQDFKPDQQIKEVVMRKTWSVTLIDEPVECGSVYFII